MAAKTNPTRPKVLMMLLHLGNLVLELRRQKVALKVRRGMGPLGFSLFLILDLCKASSRSHGRISTGAPAEPHLSRRHPIHLAPPASQAHIEELSSPISC